MLEKLAQVGPDIEHPASPAIGRERIGCASELLELFAPGSLLIFLFCNIWLKAQHDRVFLLSDAMRFCQQVTERRFVAPFDVWPPATINPFRRRERERDRRISN